MRFVLAPDSFKESMTAEQACAAMQRGVQQVFPEAECIWVPMADGGEGTLDALLRSLKGHCHACIVSGPLLSQQVTTYFAVVDDGQTAVIEMAKANGIHLLKGSKRNPLLTSTHGTGEMLARALDLGVQKIIIGLGGSVTNDGGAGMAQALGVQFLNAIGEPLQVYGGNLNQITNIDISDLDPRLTQTEIIIASDVTNPLCGEHGASAIFGPQKGATHAMVQQLDQNLQHFANLVEVTLQVSCRDIAGAGAAGGLGFGLMAFAGARIQSGVELIIGQSQLARHIVEADCVFTGEGKIDQQTALGKTPFGVAQVAKRLNKPVIAFAGLVGEGIESLYQAGFSQIIGINPPDCSLAEALQNAEWHLQQACAHVALTIKKSSD